VNGSVQPLPAPVTGVLHFPSFRGSSVFRRAGFAGAGYCAVETLREARGWSLEAQFAYGVMRLFAPPITGSKRGMPAAERKEAALRGGAVHAAGQRRRPQSEQPARQSNLVSNRKSASG